MEGSVFVAKCKWCGENGSINKNGYCENCNDMIREEILRNKEILEELAQKASPFLPDEEKDHIYQDTLTAYQNLMDFKRKQVPFFKSDPVEWANAVMKKGPRTHQGARAFILRRARQRPDACS